MVEFNLHIEKITSDKWSKLLSEFDDANIYQTCAYGNVRWGSENLCHAIFKSGDEVVGIAQVMIKKLPILPFGGVAYIPWGPLVRKSGGELDSEILSEFLKALRYEFAIKRGMLLRIVPRHFKGSGNEFENSLTDVGYSLNSNIKAHCTFILALSPSMEEIRKNFEKKWRSSLSKAKRSSLVIKNGTGEEYYNIFSKLYASMISRKKFSTGVNINEFAEIQKQLPDNEKMSIWVAFLDERPISAIICAAIGDTGIYILGATDNEVIGANGSYILHWHIIEMLKSGGKSFYDLGGVDQEENPNGYKFKRGIVGKQAEVSSFIGGYDTSAHQLNKIIVTSIELIRKNFAFIRRRK